MADMEVGRFSPLTYSRGRALVAAGSSRPLRVPQSGRAQQDGSLYRSRDLGETWARFDHGVKAETT